MEKDANFKLDVTLTNKGYDHKPTNVDYRTMQWIRNKVSLNDFVACIADGYSYCHIYHGSRRVKDKFKQTQTVSIDVDDSKVSLKEFIETCTPKPTFAYETFSNNNEKCKYRFRLVYIFKEPLNGHAFVQMYDKISNMIGMSETKDRCGRVLSQLMNGTNKSAYIYRSNIIYSSVTDITVPETEPEYNTMERGLFPKKVPNALTPISDPYSITIPALNCGDNNIIYDINKKQYKPKVLSRTNLSQLLSDYNEPLELLYTSRKDFLNFYSKIFKVTRWSKLYYNEYGYTVTPEDHLSLWVRYNVSGGKCGISRFRDGEKRRNRLFIDGCLIRKIKPDISFLELLFNLVHRVYYFYDNSDGVLSDYTIISKTDEVMNYDVD
ncbi:MAG: hypothetical protein NC453_12175 [Muribaculum sp.]|nr:hypothetical protein [Muribaculum sp.]